MVTSRPNPVSSKVEVSAFLALDFDDARAELVHGAIFVMLGACVAHAATASIDRVARLADHRPQEGAQQAVSGDPGNERVRPAGRDDEIFARD